MENDDLKNETPTFGNVLLPAALLDEIIKYIEGTEETIDGEWGSSRSVKKLIEHIIVCLNYQCWLKKWQVTFCVSKKWRIRTPKLSSEHRT